jgi:hypothetical protein
MSSWTAKGEHKFPARTDRPADQQAQNALTERRANANNDFTYALGEGATTALVLLLFRVDTGVARYWGTQAKTFVSPFPSNIQPAATI